MQQDSCFDPCSEPILAYGRIIFKISLFLLLWYAESLLFLAQLLIFLASYSCEEKKNCDNKTNPRSLLKSNFSQQLLDWINKQVLINTAGAV